MSNQLIQAEVIDSAGALQAQTTAEVDMQIKTAKTYPRDLKQFQVDAMDIVSSNEATAGEMFYVLPRGGKKIEGPSVRLAEVVVSCYGNLRVQTRITSIDDKFVTAESICMDLEKNVAISHQVKRRITDRNGKRYNDDMIVTTSNAACAIAYREAVFKVVPRHNVNRLYDEARQVAIGNVKTLASKRQAMIVHFSKMGVSVEQICRTVGVASEEEIKLEELAQLKGLATSIKNDEINIDTVFPQVKALGVTEAAPTEKKLDAASLFAEKQEAPPETAVKKRGRPKGSKNKKKDEPKAEAPPEDAGVDPVEFELQMAQEADNLLALVRDETGLSEPDMSQCDNLSIEANSSLVGEMDSHIEIIGFVASVRENDQFNKHEKLAVASVAAARIRSLVPVS